MIAPIYLKIAFQVDFWLFMSMDTNPESVEKRERKGCEVRENEGGPAVLPRQRSKGKKG